MYAIRSYYGSPPVRKLPSIPMKKTPIRSLWFREKERPISTAAGSPLSRVIIFLSLQKENTAPVTREPNPCSFLFIKALSWDKIEGQKIRGNVIAPKKKVSVKSKRAPAANWTARVTLESDALDLEKGRNNFV